MASGTSTSGSAIGMASVFRQCVIVVIIIIIISSSMLMCCGLMITIDISNISISSMILSMSISIITPISLAVEVEERESGMRNVRQKRDGDAPRRISTRGQSQNEESGI